MALLELIGGFQGEAVARQPRNAFLLQDPGILSTVLASAVSRQVPLQLTVGDFCEEVHAERVEEPGELVVSLPAGSLPESASAVAELRLFGVTFRVEGELVSRSRALPQEATFRARRLRCLELRYTARLEPSVAASLQWSDAPSEEAYEARVLDFTPDGVRVELSSALPGERFAARLKVGAAFVDGMATARQSDALGQKSRTHGLEFASNAGRKSLVDAYFSCRFPSLHLRRTLEPEAVRDLLVHSGYSALRPGTEIAADWLQLDADDVSRDFVHRGEDGALVGHVSVMRLFSKTWLSHQFATIPSHPETGSARLALYLATSSFPVLMDGPDVTVLGYYDRSKRWHQVFTEAFVRWIGDERLAVIIELDRFERTAGIPAPAAVRPANVDIGPVTPSERVKATAIARGHLPRLYADGMDLEPDLLTTAQAHPAYARYDLERGRTTLALRVDGRLVGVACCEYGSRALSLFNLTNMAQIFLHAGAPVAVPAQLALLSAVREFYAARGVLDPLVVAPPGTLAAEEEPGTHLAERMGCVVNSGRVQPQYESFLRFRFAEEYVRRLLPSPAPTPVFQPAALPMKDSA